MRLDPKLYIMAGIFLLLFNCRKPYEPQVIKADNRYLVVDGVINTGANGVTSINLNRTRNLSDTTPGGIPELNAKLTIAVSNGTTIGLKDTAGAGIYTSSPLILDNNLSYRLLITTADGRNYASDPVTAKQTPVMDSLYYEQPNDFTVYVDTHDPANKTRYYRWDYIETWEHDAQAQTYWGVRNGLIYAADSTDQKFQCWTTVHSSNVIINTTVNLGSDVVSRYPITVIANGDSRMAMKYSILVRQYALTAEAYNYWLQIQKTSQSLGGLFDLQPTQLHGNIHSLSNANEPVIGFVSASSVQEQRLFIFNTNLSNWKHNQAVYSCDSIAIPVNQTDYRIYTYPDTLYVPYFFVTNGPLILISRICVDCTLFGGSTKKPSYWR
jgi:hypothetical protein